MITISPQVLRRFILGRQGLWPGRRWTDVATAIDALERLQLDPLNVTGRSQEIALWGRVQGFQPEDLERAAYAERRFFDYGGTLFLYPIAEWPYWQAPMARVTRHSRWAQMEAEEAALLDEMRALLADRGPLGNRELKDRAKVDNYRGGKDSAVALYYLWRRGEVVIHHRRNFARWYDLAARTIPAQHRREVSLADTEAFFAQKAVATWGAPTAGEWRGLLAAYLEQDISPAEGRAWLGRLEADGIVVPLAVAGWREPLYLLREDLPQLESLLAGRIPATWQPLDATTETEAVFLAPLDMVSARGRAQRLFDFEYIWEVYKPAAQRRWGYYTLPILWGDQLVARLHPRLERKTRTLQVLGFWTESEALWQDEAFLAALGRGLDSFGRMLGAARLVWLAERPAGLPPSELGG
jgi:uncharacterized protein YcaQ